MLMRIGIHIIEAIKNFQIIIRKKLLLFENLIKN